MTTSFGSTVSSLNCTKMGKKKNERVVDTEYCVDAACHVCSREFKARYNIGDRAKVCTPRDHVCKRKIIRISGQKDKLISCVEDCCRSKYYKGISSVASDIVIDSRKFLSDVEYKKVLVASKKLKNPFGIGLRFMVATGCWCGETLLVRKRHLEFKEGPLSVVQIPTFRKAGHPALPVHLDNKAEIVRELKKWSRRMKPDDFLFDMAKRTFQRIFERILDKIKPDRGSLVHLLRHTRARRLVQSGLDANSIRKEMRWASIKLFYVYAYKTKDEVSKAFKKIR